MQEKRIVVIGAGVSGLTTALLLSKNKRYKITVAAKHMPGDYDIEYASPWAGADYLPLSDPDSKKAQYERATWPYLQDLAANHPGAGICFRTSKIYTRTKDLNSTHPKFPVDPWWKEVLPDYKSIPQQDLPPGISHGHQATSVCINTALYLPYLLSRCLSSNISFHRAVFPHISDVATSYGADVVINCTGLSSLTLGGVEDKSCYPIRGQIALIRNDAACNFSVSGTDSSPDESCYGMARAAGGGTILGGCSQPNSWGGDVDLGLAERIMERGKNLLGWEGEGELDVVRHGVGLRPGREGGIRVEWERIGGVRVVHNYGHAGAGYQCSYGCAEVAVGLVEEALRN